MCFEQKVKEIISNLNIHVTEYGEDTLDDDCIVSRLYSNDEIVHFVHIKSLNSGDSTLIINVQSPIRGLLVEHLGKDYKKYEDLVGNIFEEMTGLTSKYITCGDENFGYGKFYLNKEVGKFNLKENNNNNHLV